MNDKQKSMSDNGNDQPSGMTELMYRYATSADLTLKEAKARLHEGAYLRTAAETLARFCGVDGGDPALLKKRVAKLLEESDPSQKKDSIEKKVRNWVNKNAQVISRDSALQLAFALHLTVSDAEDMLRRLCGEGFHWRDAQDIVWLFALEHGMDYQGACDLSSHMALAVKEAGKTEDDTQTMTENIRQQVGRLRTVKELEAFLTEMAPHLGSLHNTAYRLFMDFMDLLRSARMDDDLPEERKMPAREIVVTYLYNNLIPRSRRTKGEKAIDNLVKDAISRDIQQNWPDEYALARMANREIDVTRKVLILLFLACDGGETEYGDFSDVSAEDIFEDTYARLSSMLSDCGFAPLDSRTPFDWMVLYCMVADDSVSIDENIPRFLSEIFKAPESDGEE